MRTFIASLLAVSALAGSYDYSDGGASWQGNPHLAPNVCGLASSREQSPINLDSEKAEENDDLNIKMTGYGNHRQPARPTSGAARWMPTNWEVELSEEFKQGAELTRTGPADSSKSFHPIQYHFHTPSEHTVNGDLMDAELHVVHKALDGSYAVVAYFFDTTDSDETSSDFLDDFFKGYSTDGSFNASEIDFSKLLNEVDHEDVWMYDGSFTTPPCTEGVKWTLLKEIQYISQDQLVKFNEFTRGRFWDKWIPGYTTTEILGNVATNSAGMDGWAGGNNRAIQDLNDRTVYQFSGSDDDSDDNNVFEDITDAFGFDLVSLASKGEQAAASSNAGMYAGISFGVIGLVAAGAMFAAATKKQVNDNEEGLLNDNEFRRV